MRDIGSAWLNRQRPVRTTASFRVAAAPDHVVTLLNRPDALLLAPDVADLVGVPGTALRVPVIQSSGAISLDVVSAATAGRPGVAWLSHRTGITTTLAVEPAGPGCRITLTLEHEPDTRARARGWLSFFDQAVEVWRETISTVATGFRPFPVARPEAIVQTQPVLGEATGHLVESRTLTAPAYAVWQAILVEGVDARGSYRFRTGGPALAVGDVRWVVHEAEGSAIAGASEVVALDQDRTLSSRRLADHRHPAVDSWRLEEVAAGTVLTYDHQCATSHVGLPDYPAASLDFVEEQLRRR